MSTPAGRPSGVVRPQWEWVLLDAEGHELDRTLSPVFTTQYDAEEWLGERWRALAEAGAAEARLMHDGRQATPSLPLRTG
ncbi:hypothetical protein DNL40_06520 [Xylanimonas oleitrophica]|uniref:Uncharacterized protein n=1 Tax=Xylanimonas oleitrophica TaxID=2607479 RepID=A0A2W5Y6E4_9MICO|nr:hypothetical protein [Xylanimonas oleitrophica]PZR53774.1 hypothetical protein DNL40_06520 [Xylanimonas oleitrophica]